MNTAQSPSSVSPTHGQQNPAPPHDAEPGVVACWSTIGVYGQGTCQELKQHIHCHHCPVFSTAGVQLLDRPLPPEYRAERTRQFALEKETRESGSTSAVLFRVRAEWLALPTTVFQEVAERRPIHSLPHRRTGLVLGLANVRGELLICLSLGHLLGMENLPTLEELRGSCHRILVVHWEATRLAFLVDEVHGPYRFPPPMLRPLSVTLANSNLGYTQCVIAWQNRAVGLLDPDFLFSTLNRSLA